MKKRQAICYSVFFTIVILSSNSYSQNVKIDSLKNEFKQLDDKLKLLNLNNELSRAYQSVNLDSSRYYANNAIKIAKDIDNDEVKIIAINNMALSYYLESNYEKSIECIKESKQLAAKGGYDKEIASILIIEGVIHFSNGEYFKAFRAYNHALGINRKIGYKVNIQASLVNLGQVFIRINDFENAEIYLREALQLGKDLKNNQKIAHVSYTLASLYLENGNLQLSRYYIMDAISIYKKLENNLYLSSCYNQLASIEMQTNPKNALEYNLLAVSYASQTNNKTLIDVDSDLVFAKTYYELNALEKAKSYAIKAFNQLKSTQRYNYIADASMVLLNVYEKEKKIDSAFYFSKKHMYYSEKAYQSSSNNQFVKERINFVIQETELQKDKEAFAASIKLKQASTKNMLMTFVLFGFILSAFLVFYNRKLKNKNYRIAAILDEKLDLESKISKIEDAIAKDLHDNFGNRLNGALTSYDIIKDLDENSLTYRKDLLRFMSSLENSLMPLSQDIKDLLWAIKPENNKYKALVRKVNHVVEQINNRHKESIRFIYDNSELDLILPKLANKQILMIVKESINNALKYSKSDKIDILFTVSFNKKLIVKCIDYGEGFDMNSLNSINGLHHLKERANVIDFNLQIDSKIGKGTTIALESMYPLFEVVQHNYVV